MYQTARDKQFPLIYLLLSIGVVALCLGVYLWYFWSALEVRYLFRHVPAMGDVPSELSDNSISTASGTTLSYLGYTFEVPWNDVDTANVKTSGNTAIIPFRSGLTIAFLTHSPHEFLDYVVKSGPAKHDQLCAIYGTAACSSDYEFTQLVLKAKPDDVGFFATPKKSGGLLYLLMIKRTFARPDSGIFFIQTKTFKGFQFGDTKTGHGALDELYMNDGKVEFVFARKDRQFLSISQSDINRVVQTTNKVIDVPRVRNGN